MVGVTGLEPMATSCGARNRFRLGAPDDFDRCAILASLHRPPDALRRRCLVPHSWFGTVKGHGYKSINLNQKKQRPSLTVFIFLVGVTGLEPMASWSRTKRDTKLRHTPIFKCSSIIYQNFCKIKREIEKI